VRAIGFLLLCSGCALLQPATNPMTDVETDLAPGKAKCLIVLLPGVGDNAVDFSSNGFVAAVKNRKLSADVVAADATFAYYSEGSLVERLGKDVVLPAQAKGYRQTWIIGVSMGGLGSLLYAQKHPTEITGVLALAPYLGDHKLIQEIREAGGIAAWPMPEKVEPPTSDNYQRDLWRWLKAVTEGKERGPRLYLGWGRDDLLHSSIEMLAAALPRERLLTAPGGHEWSAWQELLETFLSKSEVAKSCARR
jgi:pimeloyl-ACP methyl ester carboxylesterase